MHSAHGWAEAPKWARLTTRGQAACTRQRIPRPPLRARRGGHPLQRTRRRRSVAGGGEEALAEGDHVADVRQVRVGRREGRHDLAVVRLDLAGEGRDGARHLGFRDEREEAEHGEAAVVDLDVELLGLLLGGQLLCEAERVEEVERHRVRDLLEGGEVARLAAAHVVLGAVLLQHVRRLGPELEEADDEQDLEARALRRGVPDGGRGEAVEGGVVGQGGRERPRPADPVLVDAISHKSRHRNAAVLHLSMAEEPDGGVVALVPKVLVAELERVEVAEHWVLRLREAAEVLRHDDGAGRRRGPSDGRERGGRSERDGEH
mmetsp:Transcript_4809/g.15459  ORF Transcript_4809/g.15459 Transcript_4809/m.15459 type:complete len:318 (+) Transcript_4809:95-1048(+)